MRRGPPRGLLARRIPFALLLALSSAAAPRPSIAVFDVSVADASATPDIEATRASLSVGGSEPRQLLAADLDAQGYAVIDSARIDAALVTMGESAITCVTQSDCAARLGKTLGAERVVLAKVIKVSSIVWVLEGALLDPAAGRILRREEFELKGNIGQLLPQALRSIARRLAAADPRARAEASPRPAQHEARKPTREQVLALLAASSERAPADLTDADLSGLDLTGTDFRRADLSRSRLVGATLSGAKLFGVKLTDAVATGAVLPGAVLDLAVLERTDLTGADLRGASLYATILTGAVLVDADLTRARIISSMVGAKLMRAKLAHADLGADAGNQPMGVMRTDLSGANLAGADLSDANLRKVNFTRADLSGADVTGADIAGADFLDATLRAIRGRSQLRGSDQAKNLDRTAPGD